jgi:hypothetical protein
MKYFFGYFLPGVGLIVMGFWAGTLKSPVFSLLGFLSFFVLGVTLIIEGKKKSKSDPDQKD